MSANTGLAYKMFFFSFLSHMVLQHDLHLTVTSWKG